MDAFSKINSSVIYLYFLQIQASRSPMGYGMHRMVLRTGQLLLSYDCCVCTPSPTNLVWESDQKATTLTCRVDKKKSHTFHPSSGGNSKAIRVNRYYNYKVAILFKFQRTLTPVVSSWAVKIHFGNHKVNMGSLMHHCYIPLEENSCRE